MIRITAHNDVSFKFLRARSRIKKVANAEKFDQAVGRPTILAVDKFTWDKPVLLTAFSLEFFTISFGKYFLDHKIQIYELINLHSLICKQW